MQKATYQKVMARVVWPLAFLIVLSSLDRVNVSFAAIDMNQDLGMDAKAYGFGVGIFFWGYLLFQLPSTMMLRRIGPRFWIAGSVIGWGTVATAMALIQTPTHFYILRFLLGAFESGFAPGVVWFVSQWLPREFRARAIGATLLAIPTSVVLGGPLCGALMAMDTGEIESWRVMFAVEGLATVIAGIFAYFCFVDRPAEAKWLSEDERASLEQQIEIEAKDAPPTGKNSILTALSDPMLWLCAGIWFALISGANAIISWLPIAIKNFGLDDPFMVGVLSALPWVAIGLGMALNARHSDKSGERFGHIGIPMLISGLALGCVGIFSGNGLIAMTALIIFGFGLGGAQSVFWTIPTRYVGARNPAAITLINLCGNLSSTAMPVAIGWAVMSTGSMAMPAYFLAILLAAGALLLLPLRQFAKRREESA